MTTIAYRDGVMASDSRAYSGSRNYIGSKNKIHRLSNGSLIGLSSSVVGECERLKRFVEGRGVELECELDMPVQALLVTVDGSVYYFSEGRSFSGPINNDYFAIGSGEQYAIVSMSLGASAAKSIETAIEFDVWTGGDIKCLELNRM